MALIRCMAGEKSLMAHQHSLLEAFPGSVSSGADKAGAYGGNVRLGIH